MVITDPEPPGFDADDFNNYQSLVDEQVEVFKKAIFDTILKDEDGGLRLGAAMPALDIAVVEVVKAVIDTYAKHNDLEIAKLARDALYEAQINTCEARIEMYKKKLKGN